MTHAVRLLATFCKECCQGRGSSLEVALHRSVTQEGWQQGSCILHGLALLATIPSVLPGQP